MLTPIILFVFGLCVGSFLNVVISWLEGGRSGLLGRSFCDNCQKTLQWYELIPLFGFLFLKGRCRSCKAKIPLQYPLVELSTGILFLISYFLFLNHFLFLIFYLIIVSLLIVLFVYDCKHYQIPDIIIYPALGLAFLHVILSGIKWSEGSRGSAKQPVAKATFQEATGFFAPLSGAQNDLVSFLFAALIAAGFFAFLVLISKETWMGWGDVEIAGLMGLLLGWPKVLPALFLAFLIGAIYGIILIGLKKKKMKSQVPFGPFLIGSTVLLMLLPQASSFFFSFYF